MQTTQKRESWKKNIIEKETLEKTKEKNEEYEIEDGERKKELKKRRLWSAGIIDPEALHVDVKRGAKESKMRFFGGAKGGVPIRP